MATEQGQKTASSDDSKQTNSMDTAKREMLSMQMDYAWKWFQYHADQRLKAFNFFILLLGALLVAYATAMKEHNAAIKDESKTEERRESSETAANLPAPTNPAVPKNGPAKLPAPTEPEPSKNDPADSAPTGPEPSKNDPANAPAPTGPAAPQNGPANSPAPTEREASNNHPTGRKTSPYSFFAGVVAACGVLMSCAFFCIEVRNAELVECGRACLDKLEEADFQPDVSMTIRRDDNMRVHLREALRFRNTKKDAASSQKPGTGLPTKQRWYEVLLTHKVCFRFIYILAAVCYFVAALWSFLGFKW